MASVSAAWQGYRTDFVSVRIMAAVVRVSGAVELPATVEDVFRWLDQPEQLVSLTPLPTTIVDCRRLPNGGWFSRALVDDPAGRMELVSEAVEYEPPVRVVSRALIKGRHPVTTARALTPIDAGTRLRVEQTYRVPVLLPLADNLYERRWRALGQQALDDTLSTVASSFSRSE